MSSPLYQDVRLLGELIAETRESLSQAAESEREGLKSRLAGLRAALEQATQPAISG